MTDSSANPGTPSPFPHPFVDNWASYPATESYPTLEEQQIQKLSWTIRQKPEWYIKYKNPEILSKWKKEALSQPINGENTMRESLVDYALAELAYYDKIRELTGGQYQQGAKPLCFYGDNTVPEELKAEFVKGAKKLEDVPESRKDYHPGSDNRVLDLVHPSLYPLQYGITPVVEDMENDHVGFDVGYAGNCKPMPKVSRDMFIKFEGRNEPEEYYYISHHYQWLPSLFQVSETGNVEIKSYINNLHPVYHKELYQPIADIFSKMLPAFNEMLRLETAPERTIIEYPSESDDLYYPPQTEELDDDGYDEYLETRMPLVIDPEFKMPDLKYRDEFTLNGRELKVIVKLANIELTPENPEYKGGVWHLEGTLNEDIVGTGLYYYDCDNITETRLMFRPAVRDPEYAQSDVRGVEMIFGIEDDDKISLPPTSLEAVQDRIIVFPNLYQHKVAPFKLQDETKKGHRKILCFFLVDPFNSKVISTDKVPPQQQDWWVDNVFTKNSSEEKKDTKSKPEESATNPATAKKLPPSFMTLPAELQSQVISFIDWPMPLAAAKEVRVQLMAERSKAAVNNFQESDADHDYENGYERNFSLCEH